MKYLHQLFLLSALLVIGVSCNTGNKKSETDNKGKMNNDSLVAEKVKEYIEVTLTADLSKLTANEKKLLPVLIEIAQIMDDLYWDQAFGKQDSLQPLLKNEDYKKLFAINYGPWERLNGNLPFVDGFGEKPKGANFYPGDMTKEEFDAYSNPDKTSQYTILRRNEDGSLKTIWYHEVWPDQIKKASELLLKAAALADDPGLKKYLTLRADALLKDDYFASDMAWMDMKSNGIDFVVGPIENYEDELFGYKTAFESSVLIKDKEWSKKLEKFSSLLPKLQTQLPVDAKYKKEVPGSSSDLNAYEIVYYAGHSNSGSKTIAINLPNDEKVQLEKGSRRLQLKNTMKAKFDNVLLPIANVLMDPAQLPNVKFDAFFNNVMFHEVAHGLGIKNTITGKGPVKTALKETYSSFEEAKADVLGLFLVSWLIEAGEIKDLSVEDCYVTFLAGIFRSVRFGVASSHGKANMMCFNYFEDNNAFSRTSDGKYKVDMVKMKQAVNDWAAKVIMTEGDGDYAKAVDYLTKNSVIRPGLQAELDKIKSAKIPVDIDFKQGVEVLGLTK
jgi:hypothetical protein